MERKRRLSKETRKKISMALRKRYKTTEYEQVWNHETHRYDVIVRKMYEE